MRQKSAIRKRLPSFVAMSACAIVPALWVTGAARAQTGKVFEPKQLQEDFQIARHSLEEGQSGLYRYTRKADLDRVFDEAERSLDHPMDCYEFYRVMMPTIAAIKSGHTTVDMPSSMRAEIDGQPWLPFDVKVMDSKPYIFRDYARSGGLAGRQILSINGVPAERILSTMLAAISKDGDIQTSRQREVGSHFGEYLITLLGLRAPYEVVLTDPANGMTEKVHLAGLKHEDLQKLSKVMYPLDQPMKDFADLKFLDNGQIAVVTYSLFGENVDEGKAFMKRSFEAIRINGSRVLILDLRGNPGGEDMLGALLFSYLTDAPFKYFEDIVINKGTGRFSFATYTEPHRDLQIPDGVAEFRADGKAHITFASEPLLGIQQPSNPVFTGPLFILIDGGCFSTTADFLSVADSHHRGVFIGEESGGGYYGSTSGNSVRITLPNTKMGLFIPVMDSWDAVGNSHDAARGVTPDFLVKYTIADRIAGVDKDFELALELARKSK